MNDVRNQEACYHDYHDKLATFQRLLEVARGDLTEIFRQHGIVVNALTGRVKTFESYYKKISDGTGAKIENPIENLQDLVGLRAVLVFVEDLESISAILGPTFEIVQVYKRGSENSDNSFGYISDHYVLRYSNVEGPRYHELRGILFELQVRTILMDAWASLSHELEYKTKEAIPSSLRKIFFGLSGMFFVADKTFQDLRNASRDNQAKIQQENQTVAEILNEEINLDTLKKYLSLRFPDRYLHVGFGLNDDEEYSEFIREINLSGGYSTLRDLDEAIESALDIELESEREDLPRLSNGRRHLVGTLRGVMDLYDDVYFNKRHKEISTPWAMTANRNRERILRKKMRN